ncbi:MAG: neutral zinc metallopeptidase [Gemmatimonadota bacterium]
MRWKGSRGSSNVKDRRGGRAAAVGGGLGGIVMVVLYLVLGGDPGNLDLGGGSPATGPPPAGEDRAMEFASVILASTEDVWSEAFSSAGLRYIAPSMVVYSGRTSSACGLGSSAMGPFYCPPDRTIYLDLTFFDDLARLGGPGDFAAAYVIGHEVAHHVQNLLGTTDQVRQLQARASELEANALSVRLELQADCYAGVWANQGERNRRWLEPGDVEEGLAAAAAIGDDRLQRRGGGEVVPETFTHGSASQRQRALRMGLDNGDPEACDAVGG